MQQDQQEFARLLARVAAGSEDAARELIERHKDRICQVIRRRLRRELRPKFDSQDFVQAVWASFFANRELIGEFQRPEDLVAYLGAIAANKVVNQHRSCLGAASRDVRRERSIDDSQTLNKRRLIAKAPTPSQIAMADEQLARLLNGQPPRYQRIVQIAHRRHDVRRDRPRSGDGCPLRSSCDHEARVSGRPMIGQLPTTKPNSPTQATTSPRPKLLPPS